MLKLGCSKWDAETGGRIWGFRRGGVDPGHDHLGRRNLCHEPGHLRPDLCRSHVRQLGMTHHTPAPAWLITHAPRHALCTVLCTPLLSTTPLRVGVVCMPLPGGSNPGPPGPPVPQLSRHPARVWCAKRVRKFLGACACWILFRMLTGAWNPGFRFNFWVAGSRFRAA